MIIIKRYYTAPWMRELNTKVISKHHEDGKHLVVLEETIFYPTGGGQPHDLGQINNIPVLDVFEQDRVVYHVLERPLEVDSVYCVLNWDRRLDHMQQHSGQHLLSAILDNQYGYKTDSFHLGEEYCSIDISTSSLPREKQIEVETKVNQVIFEDLPLLTYTLAPEDLTSVRLRKLPDVEGPLRIVEIQGLDYSPCSGTHVSKTGQIGLLKITKTETYKGMTRVYFLCGQRAFIDYRRKLDICSNLGALLSVPEAELEGRIALELERKRELEKKLSELSMELLQFKAQAIVNEQQSPFYLSLPNASIEEAQQLARSILDLTTGSVVINLGDRLVLSHNLPQGVHLGQLIKEQGKELGGRGGGSSSSAQVFFPEAQQLQDFVDFLQNEIFK